MPTLIFLPLFQIVLSPFILHVLQILNPSILMILQRFTSKFLQRLTIFIFSSIIIVSHRMTVRLGLDGLIFLKQSNPFASALSFSNVSSIDGPRELYHSNLTSVRVRVCTLPLREFELERSRCWSEHIDILNVSQAEAVLYLYSPIPTQPPKEKPPQNVASSIVIGISISNLPALHAEIERTFVRPPVGPPLASALRASSGSGSLSSDKEAAAQGRTRSFLIWRRLIQKQRPSASDSLSDIALVTAPYRPGKHNRHNVVSTTAHFLRR